MLPGITLNIGVNTFILLGCVVSFCLRFSYELKHRFIIQKVIWDVHRWVIQFAEISLIWMGSAVVWLCLACVLCASMIKYRSQLISRQITKLHQRNWKGCVRSVSCMYCTSWSNLNWLHSSFNNWLIICFSAPGLRYIEEHMADSLLKTDTILSLLFHCSVQ